MQIETLYVNATGARVGADAHPLHGGTDNINLRFGDGNAPSLCVLEMDRGTADQIVQALAAVTRQLDEPGAEQLRVVTS